MKHLFYLIFATTMLFTACEDSNSVVNEEPTPTPGAEPELSLTSGGALIFDHTGGNGEITYTLENPVPGLNVEATTAASWIIWVDSTKAGIVTFQVTENPAKENRTGAIKVTYGEKSFTVTINQRAYEEGADITVEMPNVCGIYYGNRDGGDYNYYIALTDGEMHLSSSQGNYDIYDFNTPNATYYFVDIFSKRADDGSLQVPNGTYTLDTANTGRGDQFMYGFSLYRLNNDNGTVAEDWGFAEGELVVEDGKMTLIVKLYDAINEQVLDTHHVTFNGTYTLVDNSL